jgi:hypothetical protein
MSAMENTTFSSLLDLLSHEYLETLNSLLKDAPPQAAYSLGVVSCLAWKDGIKPDTELMKAAARCEDYRLADEIYVHWKRRAECKTRGYHRIPARLRTCIECGTQLSMKEVIENEKSKIRAIR